MFDQFLAVKESYSFTEFLVLTEKLLEEEKTTGHNQDEMYIKYTKLNYARMKRIVKTFTPDDSLVDIVRSKGTQQWFVITEAWCGDSAQNLPMLSILADLCDNIQLSIVLRDDNPQLIDKYLTNGGRSIPKLIVFDEAGKELFNWGPRPQEAQLIFNDWKANPKGRSFEDFELEMHKWYTANKGFALQTELKELF